MSTIVNTQNSRRTTSKGRQPATNVRNPTNIKRSSLDKTAVPEGVYGDARFTHVVYTLVGMNVQVQVKNGTVYEGIFKTISPQMDIVLELAHKVEETGNNCQNAVPSCPTRDMIIDKLIFKKDDVMTVTCLGVDLDYAVKDTFTDSAITRGNNGQAFDMELQPWDGEDGDDLGLEEGDSANGWDPNEMFKTNQEQFCVKSSYDENLHQYTTVLNKEDTKEFRKREEEAKRIARDIEKSDDYRRHIDLENGDDEEALFSAVHRGGSQSGDKKYVPPQKRNVRGRGNNGVDNYSSHNKNRQPVQQPQHQPMPPSIPQQQSIPPQQQSVPPQQQQPIPPQQQQQPSPLQAETPHVQSPVSTGVPSFKDDSIHKINGDEESTAHGIPIAKTSQSQNEVSSQNTTVPVLENIENKRLRNPSTSPSNKAVKLTDLKEFQSAFKLEDKKGSERKEESESKHVVNKTDNNNDNKVDSKIDSGDKDMDSDQSDKDATKKSTLNPLAKEFKPNPPAPSRVHPAQTPTPPRPQTQSPVVTPIMPIHYSYAIVPQPSQATRPYQPKKAVVSAYPQDFRTAAQHATGQPLLAGTIPPQQYHIPYMMTSQMLQQQPHNYPVMGQHTRMMNPAMAQSSHSGGMDPNQGNSQAVYMPQGGPHSIPAHMSQPPSQQTHVAHTGGNHQTQGVQMTQVSGHHPAPSPVQHVQGGQGPLPGQVPPQAGTPQPMYPSQISIPGHPGLHGSHNPTSPQTIHPASNPYTYSSHPPQFTFSQGQPTSVSHSLPSQMQSQHVPGHLPVVMMPPPSNQHQFQMTGPTPLPGQGHLMHHGVAGQAPTHQQVQYVSHMPSQGQVMSYQQNQ
ncbi:hypothetical protein SNE40_003533 [Patella caerulea]|uniref:Sm domain-containing protein n=1 Tax=Patella caerulea TaxID=87958 RepID=A0AAN8Q0C9_PATCE